MEQKPPVVKHAAPSRREAAVRQSRQQRDRLLKAIHRFEATLASAAPGRESAWKATMYEALCQLKLAMEEHTTIAEAPDGLLADAEEAAPRLAARIDRLKGEHADLQRQLAALCDHVQQHAREELVDYADIRQRAGWLLTSLRHHQARETDLIYESFATDIGVGD